MWDGSYRGMVGWVMVEGLVVHGRRCPTTGWTAGLSPENFSGQFSGEFFPPKKKKIIWGGTSMSRLFARLCGFSLVLSVFNSSFRYSRKLNSFTNDIIGLTDVRRMSGDRIASVCRLHARASNYIPTIQLSCFHEHINAR